MHKVLHYAVRREAMQKAITRKKIITVVTAVACVWLAYHYFFSGNDNSGKLPPILVKIAIAARQDVPLEIQEVGSAIPYESVAVRSRIDSQLREVRFKDGDAVKQGDLLFVLDDRELLAQQKELEANIARERARFENLRLQYERTKGLTSKGYESKANLDNARAAYEAQRASLTASEATLESINVHLEYTRIVAPISGRTGTISTTVGNNVRANDAQPMVTINQIQPIRVQTALSQNYFDAIRNAMDSGEVLVSASREGSVSITQGKLEYIDNTVEPSTGTFVARALFANEEETLWPGMFVNLVLMLGDEKQALIVPEVAVQHGQNGDFVFVIDALKAIKRPVKIARMVQDLAVISEGVKEGEQVAVDGMMSLKDGSDVTIQQDKPQAEN